MANIPVYKPTIGELEKRYVMECLETGWISSKGDFIERFERQLSNFVGCRHGISVSSGTTALHTALLALGIGAGDEVIVPALTYVASANAVTYTGATPIFVDSTRDTWQMDPADVLRAITPATRAILPVHLYGCPCDIKAIVAIAKERGLFIVEDCAEALGAYAGNRHVGTFGDIATFSFYGNKTITTGEGGMVITNDATLAERATHVKGQGLAKSREYWHDTLGYNYRMTNVCAAIGCAQIERAAEILEAKQYLAMCYREFLDDFVEFQSVPDGVISSHWMVSILVRDPALRDPLREALQRAGVETRPLFYPINSMPIYSQSNRCTPIAADIAGRGICLPSYPELTADQVKYIAQECCRFLADSLEGYTVA